MTSAKKRKRGFFVRFAQKTAYWTGHPAAFFCAFGAVALWGISGPIFGYSDTWQLVINTSTTIITFLMVFLIQSTQNRDTAAMQLKLDELLRVQEKSHMVLLDLEELSEEELEKIRKRYEKLAAHARERLNTGKDDIFTEDVDMKESR